MPRSYLLFQGLPIPVQPLRHVKQHRDVLLQHTLLNLQCIVRTPPLCQLCLQAFGLLCLACATAARCLSVGLLAAPLGKLFWVLWHAST
jgi:hypothetical protein